MSDSEISNNNNEVNPRLAIKKHPILKILYAMAAISSLVLIFSLLKGSQINSSQEVYGLADAATVTCSQLESLDEVFGIEKDRSDCRDNPEQLARYSEYDKESLYNGLSVSSGVVLSFSLVLFLYYMKKPAPVRKKVVNQEPDSDKQYLLKLQELKNSGLLSDQEYQEKRKKFLENL